MKRTPLKRRRKPLKLSDQQADRQAREAFKRSVCRQPCAVCGKKTGLEAHHVLPAQHIRSYGRSEGWDSRTLRRWLYDPENGLSLCSRCHARHTVAHRRLARSLVPGRCWVFARRLGGWAVVRLEREYPEDGNAVAA